MSSTPYTPQALAHRDVRGWSVSVIDPEMLEYCSNGHICLVNVAYSPEHQARAVYATESRSAFFPRLVEHLREALPHLPGRFVIV